jgi:hypothetical protein
MAFVQDTTKPIVQTNRREQGTECAEEVVNEVRSVRPGRLTERSNMLTLLQDGTTAKIPF